MAFKRERNANIYNSVNLTSVTLNATTSTTILAANTDRMSYVISNDSSKDVWIKEQAASVDDDKKGEIVWARSTASTEPDQMYHGEVSAIAVSGTPTIYIKEV